MRTLITNWPQVRKGPVQVWICRCGPSRITYNPFGATRCGYCGQEAVTH